MTPTPAASGGPSAVGASVPPVPGRDSRQSGDVDGVVGVAGLAREVDTLRRALDHLRDHLSDLPGRVDDLTKLGTDLTNAVAALTARRTATPCPSWLLLPTDPDLARQVLDELAGWLAM